MGEYAADGVLGIDGLLSTQARRLVCFFAAQGSLARASAGLKEACGWTLSGQSIGSGMVEDACKNVIGKRLKQTAARWKRDNAQKMAVLCCCGYSDFWLPYWTAA